jgi:hypothetical protein
VSPTLWLEAKGMDARFRMERLWHTEGVRSFEFIAKRPNLRCDHRYRVSDLHTWKFADAR